MSSSTCSMVDVHYCDQLSESGYPTVERAFIAVTQCHVHIVIALDFDSLCGLCSPLRFTGFLCIHFLLLRTEWADGEEVAEHNPPNWSCPSTSIPIMKASKGSSSSSSSSSPPPTLPFFESGSSSESPFSKYLDNATASSKSSIMYRRSVVPPNTVSNSVSIMLLCIYLLLYVYRCTYVYILVDSRIYWNSCLS